MIKGRTRSGPSRTPPATPKLKIFRPISWYDASVQHVGNYVSHLLTELGRLGLEIHDIECQDRAPHTETVLSDLINWMAEPPSEAFEKLFNWQTLDFAQLGYRLEKNRSAKPKIELSAEITKMNNLSVRWHPGGWQKALVNWKTTDQV